MANSIETMVQTLAVGEVSLVVVTDIVPPAPGSSLYTREVRFFGPAAPEEAAPVVLTIQVSATNPEGIKVHTPTLEF